MKDKYNLEYLLFFMFDTAKNNDGKRKEELISRLPKYNIKKARKNIQGKSDTTTIEIDSTYVRIISNDVKEIIELVGVIKEIYGYRFKKFGDEDILTSRCDVKDSSISLYEYVKFIQETIESNLDFNSYKIIDVDYLEILDNGLIIRNGLRIIPHGIKISTTRLNGDENLEESIATLKKYTELKIDNFYKRVEKKNDSAKR
ncbi:hypothetical protein HF846_08615 [Clostridium cadaveris]|uniref:hypothetical protein n=1 Tax=Clostridium cadaveris TaxID=1529 RepID=UPI001459253B|nr:hypothetical protein [Clostridium cadaveris]NME64660.1 hypothetical protein [Clostridium cadaveris]